MFLNEDLERMWFYGPEMGPACLRVRLFKV